MTKNDYTISGEILFDEIVSTIKSKMPEADEKSVAIIVYRFIAIYSLFQSNKSIFGDIIQSLMDVINAIIRSFRIGFRHAINELADIERLRYGSNFDKGFYQTQLAISAKNFATDPIRHYVYEGYKTGFDPNIGFNTSFYCAAHDDVIEAKRNPFVHYLSAGLFENRRIEPSYKIAELCESLINKSNACKGIVLTELLDYQGATPNSREGFTKLASKQLSNLSNNKISKANSKNYSEAFEENSNHEWKLKENPTSDLSNFGLYDFRPDDSVITHGEIGKAFMFRNGLENEDGDFETAISEITFADSVQGIPPDVSIIIPIYGQLSYTLNCLHSLSCHTSKYCFEIIVADDCSPDNSFEILSKIPNIRVIKNETNLGFLKNCNNAAKTAKGEYIVLLNNDTRVCEGWLDHLIDSFSRFEKLGIVGSKLFYPDGSLQEAGAIVWQDGSAWNYGRNDDPNRPRYCYAREVDYVSGASIALKRSVWEKLGGFSEEYCPAYYEDTDLFMRAREIGLSTYFQPLSRIIHYEGKTSGTDITSGTKSYQSINKDKFYAKWQESLKKHRKNGDSPWFERERKVEKRVLILDACNPTPWADAGSKATWNLIKQYQALGYHVIFVPEDNFLFQREEVEALQAIGVECHYAPFTLSISKLIKSFGDKIDIVQLIRADVAKKNIATIKSFAPNAKIFFLNADFHFLRLERQAKVEKNPELEVLARKMKKKEIEIVSQCDLTFVHSTVEKSLMEEILPIAKIQYLPLIEEIAGCESGPTGRRDVMFLGGYGHPPNVDAAIWLISEIWPLLKEKLSDDAKLLIVGSNPPESLKKLGSKDVIITGFVPELKPWFEQTRVFVSPLRFGAGAKGKLLAAMAHGVPTVATAISAEGMPFIDGENIFLADDAFSIANTVTKIYNLPSQEWNELSKNCAENITKNFNFEYGKNCLEAGIKQSMC